MVSHLEEIQVTGCPFAALNGGWTRLTLTENQTLALTTQMRTHAAR